MMLLSDDRLGVLSWSHPIFTHIYLIRADIDSVIVFIVDNLLH